MSNIRNPKLKFVKSWRWESTVEEYAKQHLIGYSLNVPCGQSEIGSVRLDIDPNMKPHAVYDMFKTGLDYPDNTFDSIISDPPWKIDYYHRAKLFFELVRVCKVNGIIIYNATWIPTSKMVEFIEVYTRQSAEFANCSQISLFKKVKDRI